jgi:hypothetical protein
VVVLRAAAIAGMSAGVLICARAAMKADGNGPPSKSARLDLDGLVLGKTTIASRLVEASKGASLSGSLS